MAITMIRMCDHEGPEHRATQVVTAAIGPHRYEADLCDEHAASMPRKLLEIGLRPVQAQVGHNVRSAYVAASGKPFTTRDVRQWLAGQGQEVPPTGKLPQAQLEAYAEAH